MRFAPAGSISSTVLQDQLLRTPSPMRMRCAGAFAPATRPRKRLSDDLSGNRPALVISPLRCLPGQHLRRTKHTLPTESDATHSDLPDEPHPPAAVVTWEEPNMHRPVHSKDASNPGLRAGRGSPPAVILGHDSAERLTSARARVTTSTAISAASKS